MSHKVVWLASAHSLSVVTHGRRRQGAGPAIHAVPNLPDSVPPLPSDGVWILGAAVLEPMERYDVRSGPLPECAYEQYRYWTGLVLMPMAGRSILFRICSVHAFQAPVRWTEFASRRLHTVFCDLEAGQHAGLMHSLVAECGDVALVQGARQSDLCLRFPGDWLRCIAHKHWSFALVPHCERRLPSGLKIWLSGCAGRVADEWPALQSTLLRGRPEGGGEIIDTGLDLCTRVASC